MRNLHVGWQVEILHVMRDVVVFADETFSSRSEGFDCVLLALLHLFVGVGLDAGHRFAGVDLIGIDGMSIQVSHHFDRINFSLYLDLV